MIEMLSSLEMLAVNLLIFDRCNNRKYSAWITALVMTLPVLGIVLASYLLRIPFAGNARYSLVGIVYLIPLKLMYREKISRIFMTMCMAWVYTMGVVALSAQLAGFIRPRQFLRCRGFFLIVLSNGCCFAALMAAPRLLA